MITGFVWKDFLSILKQNHLKTLTKCWVGQSRGGITLTVPNTLVIAYVTEGLSPECLRRHVSANHVTAL